MFLVPLGFALVLRAHQALASPDVLDWDETYYLNAAVTAADGRGLYPYIFGYAPMPVVGGFGYAVYVYALAVRLFGPSLLVLRVLSLLASVAALAGIWHLVRVWYGSGAAWIATALTASSSLFMLSNSARMDSWTFGYVAWALVLFASAFQRWHSRRLHVLAGLVFGLGLQFHPDAIVTALACGLVYVGAWARESIRARRLAVPAQPLLYLAGWAIGLFVFVFANVLPDPAGFYKTTLLVRVDATAWYSKGTSSVFASFLDPRILLAKEAARYALLARTVPAVEIALVAAAIAAAVVRRSAADRVVLALIPAVIAATAIVLNNATPLYFIHVAPALMVPLGALFAQGLGGRAPIATAQLRAGALAAFAVAVAALAGANDGPLVRALGRTPPEDQAARAFAERVRESVEARCRIAADATFYVRYFALYPYFVSSRPSEVRYAMLFFGMTSEPDYWALKRPDVVFGPGPLPPALAAYVSANGFSERAAGVWARREGCAGGP